MTATPRSRIVRWAWLPAAIAASAALGLLVWQTATQVPGAPPAPLLGFTQSGYIALLMGLLVLTIAAFWSVRLGAEQKTFRTLAVIAVLTAILGLASYLPCPNGQAQILGPVTWTLSLFIGEFDATSFQPGATCEGPIPLALQLARFLGLTFTLTAVVLAALTVWHEVFGRWLMEFRGGLDVVVGVNPMSRELVALLCDEARRTRAASHHRLRDTLRFTLRPGVCVIDAAVDDADLSVLRAVRATAVTGDIESEDFLRGILIQRRLFARSRLRRAARRVFIVGDSSSVNRRVAAVSEQLLSQSPTARDPVVILVRLDSPWEAENWLLSRAVPSQRDDLSIVVDALCPVSVMAGQILDRVQDQKAARAIVVGDGPQLFALMSECAWRLGREQALIEAGQAPDSSVITFESWGAHESAAREWAILRRRFDSSSSGIDPWHFIDQPEPRLTDLEEADQHSTLALIVLKSDTESSVALANRAARLSEQPLIIITDDGVTGLEPVAPHMIIGGGSLVVDRWWTSSSGTGVARDPQTLALPTTQWMKLAQLNHEIYLADQLSRTEPDLSKVIAWEDLPPDKRWSNFEAVRHFLAEVRASSEVAWAQDPSPDLVVPLTDAMIDELARSEHLRWSAANGLPADDWANVDPDTKAYNRQFVRSLLDRVRLLGKQPVRKPLDGATESMASP